MVSHNNGMVFGQAMSASDMAGRLCACNLQL